MNPLTYETKRAHWKATWYAIDGFKDRALRVGQPLLETMTPARFDMLYATWAHLGHERTRAEELGFRPHRRIPMSDLRQQLGLAGATISRMAHQLEAMEYVRVVRDDPDDKRRAAVILTDVGIEVLQLALEWIADDQNGIRVHMEAYVHAYAAAGLSRDGSPEECRQRVLQRLGTIVDRARAFAWFLGSRAAPIFDPHFFPEVPRPDVLGPFYGWTEGKEWAGVREQAEARAWVDAQGWVGAQGWDGAPGGAAAARKPADPWPWADALDAIDAPRGTDAPS